MVNGGKQRRAIRRYRENKLERLERAGSRIGLLVEATVSRLQCPVQAIDQAVIAVRLAQEANRPGFQGPPAQTFLGKRRDEDNGKVMTLRDQPVLQLDSAQSRHMQIGNQA